MTESAEITGLKPMLDRMVESRQLSIMDAENLLRECQSDPGSRPNSEEDVLKWLAGEYELPFAALDSIEPDFAFVTPARINGTWWLTFAETCGVSPTTAPVVAPSPPLFYVTVQFRDDGQTGPVGSYWVAGSSSLQGAGSSPLQGAASGQIRFSDGHVDLQLWGPVNQFQTAMLLSGTMTANEGFETFSGTARDPAPGYNSILRTCDYIVFGQRTQVGDPGSQPGGSR